jgi:regulator of RNase E activity RraA
VGKERSVRRRSALPAVVAALVVLLAACHQQPVGKYDNQVEACSAVAPGTEVVGDANGVMYCAPDDAISRVNAGEELEDFAKFIVKQAENGKWYVVRN